jgi:putative resolvase
MNQAAKQLNISPITLRRYAQEGKIKFDTTPAGQRVFIQQYLDDFLGIIPTQVLAFYARDSGGDKINIQSQFDKLEIVYGRSAHSYKDGASGLNENRAGLWKLVKDAKEHKYNTLAITAKDRLTRFGYKYLEELLAEYGVIILVLDDPTTKTLYDELMADFMSLIASFSGKFYKLRGIEQRKQLLSRAQAELNEN